MLKKYRFVFIDLVNIFGIKPYKRAVMTSVTPRLIWRIKFDGGYETPSFVKSVSDYTPEVA
jgi:hypothetical protein